MLIRYVMLYCNKFTACNIWYSQDNESHVFSLKCTHVYYIYTKTTRYKQPITQFCQRIHMCGNGHKPVAFCS